MLPPNCRLLQQSMAALVNDLVRAIDRAKKMPERDVAAKRTGPKDKEAQRHWGV